MKTTQTSTGKQIKVERAKALLASAMYALLDELAEQCQVAMDVASEVYLQEEEMFLKKFGEGKVEAYRHVLDLIAQYRRDVGEASGIVPAD